MREIVKKLNNLLRKEVVPHKDYANSPTGFRRTELAKKPPFSNMGTKCPVPLQRI